VLGTCFALTRRYRERYVVPAMALSGVFSALLVLPVASPLSVASSDVAALGVMGLVVLPLSFGLIFLGPRYIPAPEVSLVLLLEAVLGPYWVWLALGEEPSARTLVGGSVVLATLALHSVLRLLGEAGRSALPATTEN
jgi:drug/metabolite transporter (DMT)-like permease